MKTTSYILGLICVAGVALVGGVALFGRVPVGAAMAKPSPEAVEAKTFLSTLYGHYAQSGDFSPLNEHAVDWFDPALVALMREDAKLAQGEVGAIDGDPVCDCQDYGRILADIKVLSATATTARAAVVLTDRDASPSSETALAYDLVKVKGAWRIHDITESSGSSLRQRLLRSNAELKTQTPS